MLAFELPFRGQQLSYLISKKGEATTTPIAAAVVLPIEI